MLDHKMQETNSKTPREYMEWENKLLRSYHENVFRELKWLQTSLINTHPNVTISTLTFIFLSVFLIAILYQRRQLVACLTQFTTVFLKIIHG